MKSLVFTAQESRACREGIKTQATIPALPYHLPDIAKQYPPFTIGDTVFVREPFYYVGEPNYKYMYKSGMEMIDAPWTQASQMPADAARTYLKVTGIRFESLYNITTEDAIAEGTSILNHTARGGDCSSTSPFWRESFFEDWDYKYGETPFSHNDNPNVWVVTFDRVEYNERN